MSEIINFFGQDFFIVAGGISVILAGISALIVVITIIILVARGIIPILYRLGMGLSKRKIAIFARDEFESLQSILVESGIFKESNIVKITPNSIDSVEVQDISLFLVHFQPFSENIYEIMNMKKYSTAMIVYSPERIEDPNILNKIQQKSNSALVNFKGRMLNDVLSFMMTTTAAKK
jgi:hypothetical protein